MPTLTKIDLNKRDDCDHPDISAREQYLVKIGRGWFAGKFSRQWYGWNFDNWGTTGIQLDSFQVKEIWRIDA